MSAYRVFVLPDAWNEIKELPGNIRQRVRRAIAALAAEPRPPDSKPLTLPGSFIDTTPSAGAADLRATPESTEPVRELRRLRIDHWRIVYSLTETDLAIDVLAVRKRPPYDYGDLSALIEENI